jgi:TPR repeat protein
VKRYLCFIVTIILLPSLSHASDSYEQCRNHFLHGQYFIAEESCLKAAGNGNLDAQKWLAFLYTKGKGVTQDYQKAFYWREKAAKAGDPNSQYHLGRFFQLGNGVEKNLNKAQYWYKKAADKGDVNGLYAMGNLYRKGIGVEKDLPRAYGWYSLAAEKNLLLAEQTMASMAENMTARQIAEGKKLRSTLIKN